LPGRTDIAKVVIDLGAVNKTSAPSYVAKSTPAVRQRRAAS
jgi:hypothetical protein